MLLYLDEWVELSKLYLYFNSEIKENSKWHLSTQDIGVQLGNMPKCAASQARALPLDNCPFPGFGYKLHAHPTDFFNKKKTQTQHPNHNAM